MRFADVPGRRETDENRNAQVRTQLHLGAVSYAPSRRVYRTVTVRSRSATNAYYG